MYSLVNDYSETAHPAVISALMATANCANTKDGNHPPQYDGYSCDKQHCKRAADLIREHIGKSEEESDVHFFVGGTQTNLVTITGVLRPWEAVISAHTGHIATLETGAIEAAGHKVCTAVSPDGKLTPALCETVRKAHVGVHMVIPRMVYISNTTEIGTQYTKKELKELSQYCKEHDYFLFLDGARLGSALSSTINDLTMKDIANLTDAFYIGGTKNGTMFGEVLVVSSPSLKPNFRQLIKQRGCLLAKGWLIGVQFEALFTDKLFYAAGEHANQASMILRKGVEDCGYEFFADSYSNQQFVKFTPDVVKQLNSEFAVSVQRTLEDGRLLVRLCTSWATSHDHCRRFAELLKEITLKKEKEAGKKEDDKERKESKKATSAVKSSASTDPRRDPAAKC